MSLILRQAQSLSGETTPYQNRPRPSRRRIYSIRRHAIVRRRRPAHSLFPTTTPTIPSLGAAPPPSPTPPRAADSTPPSLTSSRPPAALAEQKIRCVCTLDNDESILFGVSPPAVSRGPAMLRLSLLLGGCVDARHVLTVLGTTAYVLGLASWCAAPRMSCSERWQTSTTTTTTTTRRRYSSDLVVNIMPSLPSRGHVPDLKKFHLVNR